jgi:hypothetical protein
MTFRRDLSPRGISRNFIFCTGRNYCCTYGYYRYRFGNVWRSGYYSRCGSPLHLLLRQYGLYAHRGIGS